MTVRKYFYCESCHGYVREQLSVPHECEAPPRRSVIGEVLQEALTEKKEAMGIQVPSVDEKTPVTFTKLKVGPDGKPFNPSARARQSIEALKYFLENVRANPDLAGHFNAIADRLQTCDALEYLGVRSQMQIDDLSEATKFLLQYACVRKDDTDPALMKCWDALRKAGKL